MAPGRLESPTDHRLFAETEKPTVYLLDTLHPTAVAHAQSIFNAIVPGDKRHAQWRENAEYLVIRGSYLTADDIESCPTLKAIGKQGVGKMNSILYYFL